MAAPIQRRPPIQRRARGEAKSHPTLLAKIDQAVKTKVEKVAAALSISQAAATELMLDSVKVDANGRPSLRPSALAKTKTPTPQKSAKKNGDVVTVAFRPRPRGEAKTRVTLLAKIDQTVKTKVVRAAAALNISQAAATELMLDSVKVDANGRPSFYTADLPSDLQKELPLTG